jgi:hypothetical protein
LVEEVPGLCGLLLQLDALVCVGGLLRLALGLELVRVGHGAHGLGAVEVHLGTQLVALVDPHLERVQLLKQIQRPATTTRSIDCNSHISCVLSQRGCFQFALNVDNTVLC